MIALIRAAVDRGVTFVDTARQWRSTGMYSDVYRPQGLEHELQLCLPEPPGPSRGPGRTVRLYFFRFDGPDFSERDRALFTLVRPHLHQAFLDAERRRASVSPLTRGRPTCCGWSRTGTPNGQIARRLGLSEATVRTHLENIHDRSALADRRNRMAIRVRLGRHVGGLRLAARSAALCATEPRGATRGIGVPPLSRLIEGGPISH